MKKFRTILAAFLLLFRATPVLQSCLDDWDDDEHPLLAIGTVRIIDGKDYYFALDEGTKMFPGDTAQVDNYTYVTGQRAFVYFNLLDEEVTGYDYNAKINHVENIALPKTFISCLPKRPTASATTASTSTICGLRTTT